MNTKDQKDLKFELELVFRSDSADILAAREKVMSSWVSPPGAGWA